MVDGSRVVGNADVLIVDDDRLNLAVAQKILEKNYKIITAKSGEEALEILKICVPKLILLDLHMPGMDGRETMREIQKNSVWRKIPIIFLTGDSNPETENECLLLGAADFIVKPFVPMVMQSRISRTIELYELREDLETRLEEKTQLVEKVSLNSIMAIANTIDAKDAYTSGHSLRVAVCAEAIAERLGWSEDEIQNIHYIALLHDIGKIGVPDSILNKPTKLSKEEFDIIKKHPIIGNDILKDIRMIKNVADGALYHHERYDGKGYPYGIKGEDIPICARIIGIADSYDAMTSNRIYRGKMSIDNVIAEFENNRGTQFDPELTDLFVAMLKEGFCVHHTGARVGDGDAASEEKEAELAKESSELLNKIIAEYTAGIKNEASTDVLTGLSNRSHGETNIDLFLHNRRAGALLMLDMDNFKTVNDTYGHIAGDNAIRTIAEVIKNNISDGDIAFRLGGDEFVILLADITKKEEIHEKCQSIIDGFNEKKTNANWGRLVTVSIGVAVTPLDGRNYKTLYHKADKALYHIKKNGKNAYAFYDNGNDLGDVNRTGKDLEHIRYMIEGRMDKTDGVFQVEYEELKTLYSYISRCVKRDGEKVQTILFTISDMNNNRVDNEVFENAMAALEVAAASSLRMVDIGSRYSSVQYFIILIGTDIDNGRMVADRVMKQFYKIHANSNIVVSYDIQTMISGANQNIKKL